MAKGKFKVSKSDGYNTLNENTIITYRSSWELDVMKKLILLYKAKRIKSWSSESTVFEYYSPYDKKQHRYFMDFTIELLNGNIIFVEVKPYSEAFIPPKKGKNIKSYQYAVKTWITNQAKWKSVREYCETKNKQVGYEKYKFEIWTEKTIYPNGKY
jgi:hypothetical protein